jgi:hypothetical protein
MFLILLVILAEPAPAAPTPHVRSTDARVLALIESGLTRSAAFRSMVMALDRSDVIVYIESKQARQQLGGYLRHGVVSQGGYRYLRLAVETHGSTRRLVSLLAHELRHAIAVSEAPQARDAETLERIFRELAVKFGCGSTLCYETQAASDIEHIVNNEFAAPSHW